MMKNFFFTLFILLFPLILKSQNITGIISNSSNQSLEYVNIKLSSSDSTSLYTISDSAGRFKLNNLKFGIRYEINFSLVGYKPLIRSFIINRDTALQVNLEIEKNTLQNVNVTAKKKLIERKVDRLVFNVEGNINAVGNDVFSLLALTPLVRVENQSISLTGKSEVTIMVDERIINLTGEALTSYLRSINAESITAIEIITNPPAQYEARGSSGIINIVTKKTRSLGLNGLLNSSFSRGSYYTGLLGANLNYNLKNKFLVFGNVSSSIGKNSPLYNKTIFYNTQTWDSRQNSIDYTKFFRGSIGIEYMISKTTSIALSFNQLNSNPDKNQTENINITNNFSGNVDSAISANIDLHKDYLTRNGNLHFAKHFNKSKSDLAIDFDFFVKKDDTDLTFNNITTFGSNPLSILNRYLTILSIDNNGYSGNLLYKSPFKKGKIQLGGKFSSIQNSNDGGYYSLQNDLEIENLAFRNKYHYNEQIQALFTNYTISLGKFDFQGGIRGEFTQFQGEDIVGKNSIGNHYFSLFPTFYITYNPSENNSFSFSYGRRIRRPNYSSLNPGRVYQGVNSIAQGNPNLAPSFSNNFEFSHTFKSLLTTILSFSMTKNGISVIELVDNNSRNQTYLLGNFISTKDIVLNEIIEFKIGKWAQIVKEFSVYYSISKTQIPDLLPIRNGVGATFRSVNNFYFNKTKTFVGGLNYNFQFKDVSGIYINKSYSSLDLTLSKIFFDNKFQLSVQARDIFRTKNIRSVYTVNNIGNSSFSNGDSRRVVLTARLNFGNTKLKGTKAYSGGGEEQNRQ